MCIYCKNNTQYLIIKNYLNFVSFSKWENLSPLNLEILVKNLSVVENLHVILSGGIFHFEPPCMSENVTDGV